jgi:hypothetical protein
VNIAWPRFYRKAIEGAVVQINGANNWMTRYPDKIFTDSACTQKLPIDLPPVETRRVHGVVVAKGAHNAIQKILNDYSGSFMIMPSLKGHDAINFNQPGFVPFCVGDVNPGGMFIHVFDDVAIKRVLEHLNTITDFTRYLNKRAAYLRSDRLALAHGEEEYTKRPNKIPNCLMLWPLESSFSPRSGQRVARKAGVAALYHRLAQRLHEIEKRPLTGGVKAAYTPHSKNQRSVSVLYDPDESERRQFRRLRVGR